MDKSSIVMLCGGGPAPGINTVVGTIAKTFLLKGYRVLGLHGGYTGLFTQEPRLVEFDYDLADRIFNTGGSFLKMSRFKPTEKQLQEDFNIDFFISNNIKLLVTVGGDDTASTVNLIYKFLVANNIQLRNIHVPKTIDNDLPLPEGIPTFGYESAKAQGTVLGRTVYEDARTSESWFIVSAMGRTAGHLAFGIGASCHYPMIIIPEMFHKVPITTTRILNLMVSCMLKRRLLGISYGAIMVSEGIFEFLSDDDIKATGINFTYDEHGHPEMGKVSKSVILNEMLERRLKDLKLKFKSRPVEVGYEVRCVAPCSFDLEYCSMLGMGVYELFLKGVSGCMVCRDGSGQIIPLFLRDLQDRRSGKIPPRQVNMNSQEVKFYMRHMMNYITQDDYPALAGMVEHPEEFDFEEILGI